MQKTFCDIRKLVIISAQVGILALINFVGHLIATHLTLLRLPGNLIGMLLLFAMLSCRIIPLPWVQEGASVLTRHFAFFFIPMAVGLTAFKGVLVEHGLAILGTLIVSAACGLLLCGFVAELADRQEVEEQ